MLIPAPDGSFRVPQSLRSPLQPLGAVQHVGWHNGFSCSACQVEFDEQSQTFVSMDLRKAYDALGPELYGLAGKGAQLLHWDMHSRFCPVCGTATITAGPICKRCPRCGHEAFPSIAPAILALIMKDDSALLVRGRNFRGNNYGLVAGFLEPGESLEECVRREVMEETGIDVANLRYFGSQPWPYPSGLMVGYLADYRGGKLILQEEELETADFFRRDNLPALPHEISLARRMIDWWRSRN